MEQVFKQIRSDGGIQNVDTTIVPVTHIFDLQDVPKMKENEKKYVR